MTEGADIQGTDRPRYRRLGRYELLGEIASGGMATVFLGRALGAKGFARLVAIKKLHPHLQNEEEFVAMFLDEARLAARIRHPNVVPTLDVDDRDGLYIVMEYVEGDRLLGLLRHAARAGGRIPAPVALRIATETLSGLHAAHELEDDEGRPLNLVHRDVSPQNVLIGVDGVTKITDFGIAKAESRLSQTRDGQLKGKIAYMAPEQTRRGEIDRRVDVFAMGILSWEMLSGRRLFRGDNDVEVLNAVVNEPIPALRSVTPDVPPDVAQVVMKALERDPDERWSTAMDFAEALEHVAASVGGIATTRAVAQYVQQVAGPKLEQERAKLRAGLLVRGRREDPSSPTAEIPRDAVSADVATPGQTPTPQSLDLRLDEPPRRRSRVVPIAAAMGVLVLAVGSWFAFHASSSRPATGATATPTPAAATRLQPGSPVVPSAPPPIVPTAALAPTAPGGASDTAAHDVAAGEPRPTVAPTSPVVRHVRGATGPHTGVVTPHTTSSSGRATGHHEDPGALDTIGVNPYRN